MTKRSLKGWKRDKPDHRDLRFSDIHTEPCALAELPPKFSIRDKQPPIWDQRGESSCTAFAGDATVSAAQLAHGGDLFEPSHNYTYYNTRRLAGDPWEDEGASCRDVYRAYSWLGYCFEATYPYDERQVLRRPPRKAYQEGAAHLIMEPKYGRVDQTLDGIKAALAAGFPVMFGMNVWSQIDSDEARNTGYIAMPPRDEKPVGGHAMTVVGWDDEKKLFELRNSWGADWGDHGYAWAPYDMILNDQIAGDLWVLKLL